MNEYEKIKLALFAIDHEAYIIQEYLTEINFIQDKIDSEFVKRRMKASQTLLESVVKHLGHIMEDLGTFVDNMDGNTEMDYKLLEIAYGIVCESKTPLDYENKDIIEQNANKENAL